MGNLRKYAYNGNSSSSYSWKSSPEMVNVMSVPNEQTQSRPVARLAQKAERILDAPVLKSLSRRIANLRASGSADKATLPTYQGKTRAVFVGINYYGTDAELKGCVSDVYAMSAFLKNTFGFPVNSDVDVLILTDEPKNKNTNLYPTSANILAALAWLIKDAKKDDSLFFHYSGHGGYKRDRNGDEFDRFDETIYPVDYQNQGPLVDDVLFSTLVGPLVAGVRLTAFFDSCHSGTVLDLPYMYNPDGTNIIQAQPAPPSAPCWNPLSLFKLNPREVPIEQRRRHPIVHDSEANVICFSGCKDDEVSIDACGLNGCFGAMSHYWVQTLKSDTNQSYLKLLKNLRKVLTKNGFNQTPCLSSNRLMDMNAPFSL